MAQVLQKDKGLKLDVDHSFADGGEPSRQFAAGGGRIEIAPAKPAQPTIHMRGRSFFYDDGTPVADLAHIQHLPEVMLLHSKPFRVREAAEAFVREQTGAGSPARADNPRRLRKAKPPALI